MSNKIMYCFDAIATHIARKSIDEEIKYKQEQKLEQEKELEAITKYLEKKIAKKLLNPTRKMLLSQELFMKLYDLWPYSLSYRTLRYCHYPSRRIGLESKLREILGKHFQVDINYYVRKKEFYHKMEIQISWREKFIKEKETFTKNNNGL